MASSVLSVLFHDSNVDSLCRIRQTKVERPRALQAALCGAESRKLSLIASTTRASRRIIRHMLFRESNTPAVTRRVRITGSRCGLCNSQYLYRNHFPGVLSESLQTRLWDKPWRDLGGHEHQSLVIRCQLRI